MGVVSPFGTSLETFRDALLRGRTGIAPITDFDTKGCRSTLAASVTGFDAPAWIPPMKLRRMDRTGAYAIAASGLAMEDARQARSDDGVDDSGVMLGTWTAGGQATQDYLSALFRTGPSGAPALLFNSTVANAAASLVGLEFKLRGPNATVSYKEASGLAAIVSATEMIREGHASALAAGGVDAVYEIFFKAYDRFHVMSPAAMPDARVAPFDESRSGFVLGEGAFMLWLEQDDGVAVAGCDGSRRNSRRRRVERGGPSERVARCVRSRWCGRCASRSMTRASNRATSTSCTHRRMRRRHSIASRPRRSALFSDRNRAW